MPSESEMRKEMNEFTEGAWRKGVPKCKTHLIEFAYPNYAEKLAKTANIPLNLPKILVDILYDVYIVMRDDPLGYRDYEYKINNDGTFTKSVETYWALSVIHTSLLEKLTARK